MIGAGVTANGYEVSFWGVERVLEPDGRVMAAERYECPAFHCTYSWQKAGQWLPRGGVEGDERQEETTEGDGVGYVHYLDGADGVTGVHAHMSVVHLKYVQLYCT